MNILFRSFAVLITATLAFTARAADDLKAMSGTWKTVKAELAGQALPPPVLKAITLKIDGANYVVTVETEKGTAVDKGTVAIDRTTTPKSMTISGVDGPNAGKTFHAIYEFGGDTLRVCYELSGAAQPAEFKTAPGTKLYLVTYERAK